MTSKHHKKISISIKHNLKVYKMSIKLWKIKKKSWRINIYKWKWLWKGWMISKPYWIGSFLIRIFLTKRWISNRKRLGDPSFPLIKICHSHQNLSLVFPVEIIVITAPNLNLLTTQGKNKLMMTISGKEILLPILKLEITDLFLNIL